MELTSAERLSLLMLCDIYDANVEKGEFDTGFVREAIYSRNLWALSSQLHGIVSEPISEEIVAEVHDLLDMWQFIEEAGGTKFPGFDSSRESDHTSVAQFLTDNMGQWESFKGRVDKGIVGLEGYQRMYRRFGPIRAALASRTPIALTADEVEAILAERIHPENR